VDDFLYLNTTELREGQVVHNSGMRILIDGPARIYEGDHEVYAWPGLVLNADEICRREGPAYNSYIACHLRGTWREDAGREPDRWTVQGNDLACWWVEREPDVIL
jgi:hypothetical protein